MVLGEGSSIDFVILGNSIQHLFSGNINDDKSVYKNIETNLKGKYLDVFVKRYDEDKIISVKGKLRELDASGKYLVLEQDSGEKDFIYFARIEDAILAIKDGEGRWVYENANIISGAEPTIRTDVGVKGLRERGRFDSRLRENYLSVVQPRASEQKLERA